MPKKSLKRLIDEQLEDLRGLRFSEPVSHVYNPLSYARRPFEQYVKRFGVGSSRTVLMGMNPGPWGMVQTGIPFGEVGFVRDWLGIDAKIEKPESEHDKRPVLGFDCKRSEVSGARIWGWAKARYGTPERFFERFFVINYCPLAFMEESGRNRTPDKLPTSEREPLLAACDRALVRWIEYLAPTRVIGIGAWAEKRAASALGETLPIGRLLHPSPASPKANRGWAKQAEQELQEMGIKL